MTIEQLAREAGFYVERDGDKPVYLGPGEDDVTPELERFAALVRAAALEEAALSLSKVLHDQPPLQPLEWHQARGLAEKLAEAIRSLAGKP